MGMRDALLKDIDKCAKGEPSLEGKAALGLFANAVELTANLLLDIAYPVEG